MIASARAEGGPQLRIYDYLAGILASLLPMTERAGLASAEEIDIKTLAARLRADAVENGRVTRADIPMMTQSAMGARCLTERARHQKTFIDAINDNLHCHMSSRFGVCAVETKTKMSRSRYLPCKNLHRDF
jgi:hypothetical protein